MKMVKTTHRSSGKAYPLSKSYNRPDKGKKCAEHMTHGKTSKSKK